MDILFPFKTTSRCYFHDKQQKCTTESFAESNKTRLIYLHANVSYPKTFGCLSLYWVFFFRSRGVKVYCLGTRKGRTEVLNENKS